MSILKASEREARFKWNLWVPWQKNGLMGEKAALVHADHLIGGTPGRYQLIAGILVPQAGMPPMPVAHIFYFASWEKFEFYWETDAFLEDEEACYVPACSLSEKHPELVNIRVMALLDEDDLKIEKARVMDGAIPLNDIEEPRGKTMECDGVEVSNSTNMSLVED